ncbi:MAG TPA: transposase [Gemmataceae bacterium]|nr:transposase [Gemmataceae bacterium]
MDAGRQQRGLTIAATMKLTHKGDRWQVPSQTGNGKRYSVEPKRGYCSCPDHDATGDVCKHLIAVQIVIQRELFEDGTETVTKTVTVTEKVERKTYPQDWPNYNRAQVNEHRLFGRFLADLCSTLPNPAPKGRGRPSVAPSDAAFCATMKVYSTMSARRFMGDLEECRDAGYISRIPHFNSVLNFFDSESAADTLTDFVAKSAAPLVEVETEFAVDSSGFAGCRYLQWVDEKWGTPKRKAVWVKAHAIVGVKTNCVAAATVLDKDSGDITQFPGLVKTAREQFTIKEVSADKAYCGSKSFDAVEAAGGKFYPAFKSNATGGVGGGYGKAYHQFCLNREEYLAHYHKRSNIESSFSGIKRLFGEALRSRTDRAMRNETLAKIVAWNITCVIHAMYELGISPMIGCTKNESVAQIIRFPGA